MNAINFLACRIFLGAIFLFVLLLPFIVLFHFFENNETFKSIRPVFTVLGLLLIFAAGWLAHRTAHHLTFENRNLYNALRFTVWDARMHLAFLPVIGKWLAPPNSEKDRDDGDMSS